MQEEGQYVMYIDADAFVVQQHQSLANLLFSDVDLHLADHGNGQGKWANVNTGVLILKNTKWSRMFMEQWWKAASDMPFRTEPFYEQSVLQHILQEGLYQTRVHSVVYPAHVFNTALDMSPQQQAQSFIMHMMSATKEERATQCSRVLKHMLDIHAAWLQLPATLALSKGVSRP